MDFSPIPHTVHGQAIYIMMPLIDRLIRHGTEAFSAVALPFIELSPSAASAPSRRSRSLAQWANGSDAPALRV